MAASRALHPDAIASVLRCQKWKSKRIEWNVGGIRFLGGDVDRCREQQMASGRSTLLCSANLVASRDRAAGRRVQLLADNGSARLLLPAWMLCAAIGIIAAVLIR